MSSSARTSPSRRPGPDDHGRPDAYGRSDGYDRPDGYGSPEREPSTPSRSGRSGPPPNAARGRASGPSDRSGSGRGGSGRSGSAAGRRPAERSGSGPSGGRLLAGAPGWLPAAAVLGGPILAVILGKVFGSYYGPAFAILTVLAGALAVAAATPNGRWWVMSALPPVAWLAAAVAELAWHDPGYATTKEKLVGLVHATTHVFPVILVALLVMGLVIAGAVVRARQSGNTSGRPSASAGGRRSGGGTRRV